eukprot:12876942-Alexandrium_andersonii.AAC.1
MQALRVHRRDRSVLSRACTRRSHEEQVTIRAVFRCVAMLRNANCSVASGMRDTLDLPRARALSTCAVNSQRLRLRLLARLGSE